MTSSSPASANDDDDDTAVVTRYVDASTVERATAVVQDDELYNQKEMKCVS